MKQLSKDWLDAAYQDILTIEEIIDNKLLTNIVAFHAQQAIEKSFKAVIEEKDITLPKIHDVIRLYNYIKVHLKFKFDIELLREINEIYIDSRYPSEMGLLPNGSPTLKDANRFYEFSKYIYESVQVALESM